MKRNDIPKEVVKSGKRDSTLVSDLITQCWLRPWLVNFKRFIQLHAMCSLKQIMYSKKGMCSISLLIENNSIRSFKFSIINIYLFKVRG